MLKIQPGKAKDRIWTMDTVHTEPGWTNILIYTLYSSLNSTVTLFGVLINHRRRLKAQILAFSIFLNRRAGVDSGGKKVQGSNPSRTWVTLWSLYFLLF